MELASDVRIHVFLKFNIQIKGMGNNRNKKKTSWG